MPLKAIKLHSNLRLYEIELRFSKNDYEGSESWSMALSSSGHEAEGSFAMAQLLSCAVFSSKVSFVPDAY